MVAATEHARPSVRTVDPGESDQNPPKPRVLFAQSHLVIACAISLLICAWFVSWGDGRFFEHDGLASFYDAQALSMITGHLDVPREAIGFEAYIFNGKAYGYFGIGPALLRIPLIILFPNLDSLWSRPMMMVACLLALIAICGILRSVRPAATISPRFRRLLESILIVNAAIGSTNVFIIARSYVFHEAIMWGCAFALLFAWSLLSYLSSPSRGRLVLSGALAFFSFHSRATAGAGALLAMCVLLLVLIWRWRRKPDAGRTLLAFGSTPNPPTHAMIAGAFIALTLGTFAGVNYAKFATLWSMPLQYYDLYVQSPSRMQVTRGTQIHPENIPTTIANYFGPGGVEFGPRFPWVGLAREARTVGSPRIDVVEPFSSFPASMPALTLLAGLGCVVLLRNNTDNVRRLRLPAMTSLAGGGAVFMTVGITERYLHDLYPALVICSVAGIYGLYQNATLHRERLTSILLVPLTVVGIWMNCSFALLNQRDGPWGVPAEKHAEFERWRQAIDAFFGDPGSRDR